VVTYSPEVWYDMSSTTSATTGAWRSWTTASTTSSTTYQRDDVWMKWADSSTVTSTGSPVTYTTTDARDVWVSWTTDSTGAVREVRSSQVPVSGGYVTPALSAAQREQREADNERWRLQREERARKREEADTRAAELLMDHLTEEQKGDMQRDGFFFVQSKRPGRKYRLRHGRMGNVDVMEEGRVLHRLCAHPAVDVPNEDTRLAQKLMLEHMEDVFIGKANVHAVRH
jgi:hypothetical protein